MKKKGSVRGGRSNRAVARRLVDRYVAGHDNDTGFVLDVLNLPDLAATKYIFEMAPRELTERLADFVEHYTPKTRVFNGPPPKAEAVEAVKRLLRERNGHRSSE
ncbi:MAG: hypothetical protein ACREHD_01885 [Pirellulales bacterium]